tara:strand:- start:501 stop:953 length:453 start_codon:yes stop_codon:yes gene_type:complete
MALIVYQCESNHKTKRLFKVAPPQYLTCKCGKSSRRYISGFSIEGEIYYDLMRAEDVILGKNNERTFSDATDIKQWEQEEGVVRCTEQEQKMYREEIKEMKIDKDKIIEEDGTQAWYDKIDQIDIQESTGWDNKTYTKWKDTQDAYEKTD